MYCSNTVSYIFIHINNFSLKHNNCNAHRFNLRTMRQPNVILYFNAVYILMCITNARFTNV